MNYGLKIIKRDQSIETTPIKDQQFNSSKYMEKIAHIFETSNATSDTDFTHGLGYTPVLIDYNSIDGSFSNRVGRNNNRVDNFEVIIGGINNVNNRGSRVYVLFQAGS